MKIYFNYNYVGAVVSFTFTFPVFFPRKYDSTSATLLSSKILYSCLLVVFVLLNEDILIVTKGIISKMKEERCRDGCRTSLLIAGGVLVPAIFHTLYPAIPKSPFIS